jgi:hypothetical protein
LKLWVALYIPYFLGKQTMVSWLASLLKPVHTLFSGFKEFEYDFNAGLKYSSQSIVLESFLNDKFDQDNRRLRVINQELVFVPRFHYFQAEYEVDPSLVAYSYFYKSEPHSPFFTYFSNEQLDAMYSFLVSYPVSLILDLNEVRAAVNFRRFAGLRYKIVKVEDDLITPIEFLTQEYE